jgi:ribonucleoside-diphosphate reductase alpha chain
MQSAFQKHVDSAVSKTINFGSDATEGDVKDAYLMADQARCKGITVYRDGSRTGQVLNVGTKKEEPKVGLFEAESIQLLHSRPRTGVVQGITEKVKIGCGNLFITVNYDDQGICEVFTQVGKGGGCPSQSEAAARLVSVSLRAGLDPKEVIEQLKGIRCHSTIRRKVTDKEIQCLSCPDAIAKTIEKAIKIASEKTGTVIVEDTTTVEENTAKCPECGSKITHQDGCVICHSCGYSKCG